MDDRTEDDSSTNERQDFHASFLCDDSYAVKTAHKNLGFFKLASIGSYINGVYCETGLPRFLIRFLFFV